MKTDQDSYIITMKENVRFQEKMHPEKSLTWSNSKWPPIGQYLLSRACYLVNHARWLDHYYVTKCEVQEKMHPENFEFDRIQNGQQSAIIYLNIPDIG